MVLARTVVLGTLKVTVQLLLDGIVIPLKLSDVAPAARVLGVVPTQVPPTAPPTALMFARVSVNAPPVRFDALLFDNVSVTTDVPSDEMAAGLIDSLSLHDALPISVRVAVLLAAPAVGV